MGQISVIGYQEQAFGVDIEAAHGKQVIPHPAGNQIQNRPVPSVFRCGDDALRFMEHVIFVLCIGHDPPIHGDHIGRGGNLPITLFLCHTVDRDASLSCHLFDLASRPLAHLS